MINQKRLHELALSIVHTLHHAGYIAYFAGGCVRDRLLNIPAQEIDIATSASPDVVQSLFAKTVAVGAQFGVIIVLLDNQPFEVATFRTETGYVDGRHPTSVQYASAEEDAKRRDFTINGMFYDPLNDRLLDFVGGGKDLKKKVIRAIGNAAERFAEDRLRMIRAVRFAARFAFCIEQATADAIQTYAASLFPAVSMERIWQELTKISEGPRPDIAFVKLFRLNLLQTIFPDLSSCSLQVIQQRVKPFERYPKKCPAIFFVYALVSEMGREICLYLKTSNQDAKLLDLLLNYPSTDDLTTWAHYYAHPHAWLCIEVLAASHDRAFIEQHQMRKQTLQKHIRRIEQHQPVVTASMLASHGVKPGPKMGELLQAAEKLSIEQNLEDPAVIITRLLQ